MLAVAFASDDTLVARPVSPDPVAQKFAIDFGGDVERSLQAQLLRPAPGALRVVRELEALGVPLVVLSGESESDARRKASLVWFSGDVVTGPHDPNGTPMPAAFDALSSRIGLPPECIWYVSGRAESDAIAASEAGMHGVYVGPAARAISEPEHGAVRVSQLDDVLELIRGPYTRAVLDMRYLMRTVLRFP